MKPSCIGTAAQIMSFIEQHGPRTAVQLAEELNVTKSACLKAIAVLRKPDNKQLYKSHFVKIESGVIPFYAIGSLPDATAEVSDSKARRSQRKAASMRVEVDEPINCADILAGCMRGWHRQQGVSING